MAARLLLLSQLLLVPVLGAPLCNNSLVVRESARQHVDRADLMLSLLSSSLTHDPAPGQAPDHFCVSVVSSPRQAGFATALRVTAARSSAGSAPVLLYFPTPDLYYAVMRGSCAVSASNRGGCRGATELRPGQLLEVPAGSSGVLWASLLPGEGSGTGDARLAISVEAWARRESSVAARVLAWMLLRPSVEEALDDAMPGWVSALCCLLLASLYLGVLSLPVTLARLVVLRRRRSLELTWKSFAALVSSALLPFIPLHRALVRGPVAHDALFALTLGGCGLAGVVDQWRLPRELERAAPDGFQSLESDPMLD